MSAKNIVILRNAIGKIPNDQFKTADEFKKLSKCLNRLEESVSEYIEKRSSVEAQQAEIVNKFKKEYIKQTVGLEKDKQKEVEEKINAEMNAKFIEEEIEDKLLSVDKEYGEEKIDLELSSDMMSFLHDPKIEEFVIKFIIDKKVLGQILELVSSEE